MVQGADRITAHFRDRRALDCDLMETDEVIDLAVLKVKERSKSLPSMALGSSEALKTGDWAIATWRCLSKRKLWHRRAFGMVLEVDIRAFRALDPTEDVI